MKKAGRTKDNAYDWQRWYNGSLYVGVVNAGHERRRQIVIRLPFDFKRVVQYPSGLTIIQPNKQGKLTIDSFQHKLIPVQMYKASQQSTRRLYFLMYECDVVVWRFDPK